MAQPRDCVPALESHGLDEMAEWASSRPIRHGWKGRTCRDLWAAAPRGDWLLEYAHWAGADRRDLVRAAAACVRPALRFVPEGEDRPKRAIEAAERWADDPTMDNLQMAKAAGRAVWKADGTVEAAWRHESAEAAARSAGHVALSVGRSLSAASTIPWTAGRAAVAAERAVCAEGGSTDDMVAASIGALAACADAVRRLVPFLDLSARGGG